MTAILVALGVVRGLGYWAVGEYSRDVLVTVAIALPMMLVGIYIGNRIHTGISELAFRRLVSGALTVSGLALLLKSTCPRVATVDCPAQSRAGVIDEFLGR